MNQHCLYCDEPIQDELSWFTLFFHTKKHPLCHKCRRKLARIEGSTCRICCRPLAEMIKRYIHNDICSDCVRWERHPYWAGVLDQNISLYRYNEFLKQLIARFKYRGDYILAHAFSEEIHSILATLSFDYLVPIPLSEERLLERGFNQASALAVEAGFATDQLLKRVHGEKQSKKSRQERIKHGQLFALSEIRVPTNRSIVLIDDIYTTGATVRHAAMVLKQAGAKSVISFTLARG